MQSTRVALIEGDGIGPEITSATLEVLAAAGFQPEWVRLEAGLSAIEKGLPAMPKETVDAVREIGVALKGPTTTPVGTGHVSANVELRKALHLFANVRPSKSLAGIEGPLRDRKIDLIIVRENTEDLYAGIEFMVNSEIAQGIKVITREGCRAVCEYAFRMARQQGRKKVTAVHKANIMKRTDGLFLEEFRKVAADYSEIEADDIIIDNCCLQLVTRPERFDVFVTENLYGDIISDLCAGLVGGLGIAPGANIGQHHAVFEAVHGSAPDIAGKGLANPTALLFSAIMMLRHLGHGDTANRIGRAITTVFREGKVRTGDLGGTASTREFTQAILERLKDS